MGIRRIWTRLSQPFSDSPLLRNLARGAGIAFLVQVSGVGLTTYIVQIFLARWLGTAEFGVYEYVISLTLLLGIVGGLGLPTAVLRFIAEYQVTQQWQKLRGLIRGTWRLTGVVSIVLTLGTTVLIFIFQDSRWIYFTPLLIGVWLVPFIALAKLQLEIARAFNKILLAYAPFHLIEPCLVFLGAFILWKINPDLTSEWVLSLSVFSLMIVVGSQWYFLQHQLKREYQLATPDYQTLEWLQVAFPLLLQGVFSIVLNQTDILMIGTMVSPEAVGIYSAAAKTSVWTEFVLQAVNTVVAPVFTTLYTQNDRLGLQSLVTTVAHWIFWPSIILSIAIIAFANPILSLFGSEFLAARIPMTILIFGQLVNVGSGSVGYLMVMTGHQNQSALIFGCSAVMNVILNAITIPLFGIVGAAISTALAMALWNILLHILVVRYLNVYPSIVYAIFAKPNPN
ncbi:MAG: flippase [Limnoraphis sp. WC205]|jgi:O-antigen/teichoic acid export membrane protein|nr:flippase [Limnoraphis sp. WC205]